MEPFKHLISPALVGHIAAHLEPHVGRPTARRFRAKVLERIEGLEMKGRVQLIADILLDALPTEVRARHRVLGAMLHPDIGKGFDRASDERGIAGWGIWPLSLVVGQHGLDDFDGGLALLREMTRRSTAEFAIRYLLVADQPRALALIAPWVDDPDEDVRRLASEGTRPRLPWGLRLQSLVIDPHPTLPLLESLKDDPSAYVRRSVANHLNDIAKDHPELVVDVATLWMRDASKEREALVRHACRTLVKAGHPGALALFGFAPAALDIGAPTLSATRVRMGETLEVAVDLRSTGNVRQKLAIDVVLHYRRANGALSPKVFKGAVVALGSGESVRFTRSHAFREVTTRRHYGGEQAVSLRINGVDTPPATFELVLDREN